jgi:sugar phosphate isomerase/epimerase
MRQLRIGVHVQALGLSLRRGIAEAERLGVGGVQLDATGELAANNLSQTGRRELRHLLRAHNLEPTALGCPLRRGLDVAENQQGRIDHVKKVQALAFDLGARVVIVEAGRIPEDLSGPSASLLTEALLALAQQGDRSGVVLALQTGLEPGLVLSRFLDRFDTGGLGVNFDPANLLSNGSDPYESAAALHGRIVHAHARDARQASASRAAQEVPLGHGDIDWLRLLSVLEEIDYHGWLTIVRDTGSDRRADVAAAVGFLRRFIG